VIKEVSTCGGMLRRPIDWVKCFWDVKMDLGSELIRSDKQVPKNAALLALWRGDLGK